MTHRESLDIQERQITAWMQHEVEKFGHFSCDWNIGIMQIQDERKSRIKAKTLDDQKEDY